MLQFQETVTKVLIFFFIPLSHKESEGFFGYVAAVHFPALDKLLRHPVIFDNRSRVPFLNRRFVIRVVEQVLGVD